MTVPADDARIDDLRRRVQKDPASIAFAQLAEELRRAGRCQEAVSVCRTGLATYPEYLSARVTLGRSLLELNQLADAERELEVVRSAAPENLAAIRALAEIHERREASGSDAADAGAGAASPHPAPPAPASKFDEVEYLRIVRTLTALESWLAAVYVTRAERSA